MKGLYKNKYRIKSARLKSWDYTTPWWYYVTICTKNKKCWFGNVKNGKMHLNDLGKIVNEEWLNTKKIRANVDLDFFVIMPNHLHGIIIINSVETTRRVVSTEKHDNLHANKETSQRLVSTEKHDNPRANKETSQRLVSTTIKPNSLGSIIGQIKSITTKRIRAFGQLNFAWQPRFYDHIIRNEKDLFRIRKYIESNPLKWETEKYYINT